MVLSASACRFASRRRRSVRDGKRAPIEAMTRVHFTVSCLRALWLDGGGLAPRVFFFFWFWRHNKYFLPFFQMRSWPTFTPSRPHPHLYVAAKRGGSRKMPTDLTKPFQHKSGVSVYSVSFQYEQRDTKDKTRPPRGRLPCHLLLKHRQYPRR